MAGPNIPAVSAGSVGHITHSNLVKDVVNKIDKDAAAIAGDALVQNSSSLYIPVAVEIIVRWNSTTDTWPARPTWAPFGVVFLSTNDAAATQPPTANLAIGDRWIRHPDAP